jgi:hypothetical protein
MAAGVDVGIAWINANLGRRAFVSALDAQSGAEVWMWYTTKEDGWESDYAATTPDGMPLHRDIAAEKAAAQLYKNAWAAGSNSTWMTPAFDAATGRVMRWRLNCTRARRLSKSRGLSIRRGPRHGGARSVGRNVCCDGLADGIGTDLVVRTKLDSC